MYTYTLLSVAIWAQGVHRFFDFGAMAPKRARSLANPAVSETVYYETLRRFAGGDTLWARLGPVLYAEGHAMSPCAVMRCAPLCTMLIEQGCRNGVILPSRVETAVKRFGGVQPLLPQIL